MFEEKKINDIIVKPIISTKPYTGKTVRGYDLIPQPYYNLYICARTRSGKTSVISTLCEDTTDKNTIFYLFVSTYRVDPTWIKIIKMLEDRGNVVLKYDSIMDDSGKIDQLQEIMDTLGEGDYEAPSKKKPPISSILSTHRSGSLAPEYKTNTIKIHKSAESNLVEGKPRRKSKKQCAEHVFIFDDLSSVLRSKSIGSLLKKVRHYKGSCIISSQYYNDIKPEALMNLHYVFIFRGMPEEKLLQMHEILNLAMPFPTFLRVYEQATEEPYSFLYLNRNNEEVRKCFNTLIKV